MATLRIAPTAKDLAFEFGNAGMKAKFPSKENFVGITNGVAVSICRHLKWITPVALAINAKESAGLAGPGKQGLILIGVHVGDDSAASLNDCLALQL